MHLLGYFILAIEVVALAGLSQLWLAIRVQRFLRHFAIEAGAEPSTRAADHADAPTAHRLAA